MKWGGKVCKNVCELCQKLSKKEKKECFEKKKNDEVVSGSKT